LRNLEPPARLWRVDRAVAAQRIGELAAALGLDGLLDRPVESFSGGERRRLEIARALVSEPDVLFLDEPTVGLDPRIRHELLDVIGGLRDRKEMTILLTTHYLDEAERLCDRIAIIHAGEIVALDTPEAFLADPASPTKVTDLTTIASDVTSPPPRAAHGPMAPLATLVARRFQLSVRTPRELVVPLLTPILFALVIAPALKEALHTSSSYEAFVATGTIGLLIPLNTMFAGLGVIVDRESGAQRELLAAPIPRALLVLGNLAVAFAITALQVAVLIVAAVASGIPLNSTVTRVVWFV